MENKINLEELTTTREAGHMYGKHPLTISKIMKQHFTEGVHYRYIKISEKYDSELLILTSCLDDYFKNPSKYKKRTAVFNKILVTDRNFRI